MTTAEDSDRKILLNLPGAGPEGPLCVSCKTQHATKRLASSKLCPECYARITEGLDACTIKALNFHVSDGQAVSQHRCPAYQTLL